MIQQLCVDLVYTILYTVTKHTVGITKEGRWTVYQDYDFNNRNKFPIETMLVKSSFFSKGDTAPKTEDETEEPELLNLEEKSDNEMIIETGVSEPMGDDDGKYEQYAQTLGITGINESLQRNPQSVAQFEDIDKSDQEEEKEQLDEL